MSKNVWPEVTAVCVVAICTAGTLSPASWIPADPWTAASAIFTGCAVAASLWIAFRQSNERDRESRSIGEVMLRVATLEITASRAAIGGCIHTVEQIINGQVPLTYMAQQLHVLRSNASRCPMPVSERMLERLHHLPMGAEVLATVVVKLAAVVQVVGNVPAHGKASHAHIVAMLCVVKLMAYDARLAIEVFTSMYDIPDAP